VDVLPIFEKPEKLEYRKLLQSYFDDHGKMLKPVKPHKDIKATSTTLICPICNDPHDYLYDNNGGRGQYLCKIYNNTFNHSYKTTNGFNSFNGSISFVTLFCTYTLIL